MSKLRAMMDADLDNVLFADFGSRITPDTWGGCDFLGIFDEDLVDLEEASIEAPYLLVPADKIPAGASQGDLLTVEIDCDTSTQFKILDIQFEEDGLRRIILGAV